MFKTYTEVYMNGDQAFPLDVTTEYFRVINDVVAGNIPPAEASKQLQTFIDGRSKKRNALATGGPAWQPS